MAFAAEDFRDLLRLLDEHPEWKAELRRAVLADDVLELPRIMRELAEAQKKIAVRMGELAEAQKRTEEAVWRLVAEVGALKGYDLERRFRERAPAWVRRPFRRARLLPLEAVGDELGQAVDDGKITEEEADDAIRADAFLEARDGEGPVLLVVEISPVVDERDVERAVRRARVLERAGRRAKPAVAGVRLVQEAKLALDSGGAVWLKMDVGDD